MIKTIGDVEYIVHQWSNVTWAWSEKYKVYGVHPEHEQRFIKHIRLLSILKLRQSTDKLGCLVILNLILSVWKQAIE